MALAGKSIHLYRRLRIALHSLYVLAGITYGSRRWTRWIVELAAILVRHAAENEFLTAAPFRVFVSWSRPQGRCVFSY